MNIYFLRTTLVLLFSDNYESPLLCSSMVCEIRSAEHVTHVCGIKNFFFPSLIVPPPHAYSTMGHLAESKRKKKLAPSHHAQTVWSKNASESSIGFKLMASMGWAPGKGLGTDLHGEKDNIKYTLKDDLLGIGAKKEYGGGVWRGMAEVDDLYKKLDVGSGTVTPKEEANVEEVKEIKLWGGWKMNFQVGDMYTSSFTTPNESGISTPNEVEVEKPVTLPETSEATEKKSKKRKRDGEGKKEKAEKKEKKAKKDKKVKYEIIVPDTSISINDTPVAHESNRPSEKDFALDEAREHKDAAPKSKKKKDSKDKKKEKKEKKEKQENVSDDISTAEEVKMPKKDKKKRDKEEAKAAEIVITEGKPSVIVSTRWSENTISTSKSTTSVAESDSGRSTPVSRHMHRARFMAMKRASVSDQNALREILGVAA